MSSNIFLTIAIVTTGIFAVQFILSIFLGDIDEIHRSLGSRNTP